MSRADTIEGGCSCRAVRYRLTGAPMFVNCCHCRWCQRETGSAFAINAVRFVRVGTLDDPDRLPPEAHIFTANKQAWVVPGSDVPVFAEYYEIKTLWPVASQLRRAAVPGVQRSIGRTERPRPRST